MSKRTEMYLGFYKQKEKTMKIEIAGWVEVKSVNPDNACLVRRDAIQVVEFEGDTITVTLEGLDKCIETTATRAMYDALVVEILTNKVYEEQDATS